VSVQGVACLATQTLESWLQNAVFSQTGLPKYTCNKAQSKFSEALRSKSHA